MKSVLYAPKKRSARLSTYKKIGLGNDPPEFKPEELLARLTKENKSQFSGQTSTAKRLWTLLETVLASRSKDQETSTDDVFHEVVERRNGLLQELVELDQFINAYKPSKTKPPVGHKKVNPVRARRRGAPNQFVALIEQVIKDAGKPLSRADIVSEIESKDISIPGQHKTKYVGTLMWREREKFIHIVGHGYWLKYQPLPKIGYDPASLGRALKKASKITITETNP